MSDDVTLKLSRYERDNLLALLHLAYRSSAGGPTCLGTGDWVGQIYWRLAAGGFDPHVHNPNKSPEMQINDLLCWAKSKATP